MRWLGMIAGIFTLTAVVLNTIWFIRRGGIPAARFLSFSGMTFLYLMLFVAGVFAIGWLSGRLLTRLDPRGQETDDHGGDDGQKTGEER